MNRFNQILINAAPPSDDHGSKYIYIYISYSPWTGTSFDNSITVCIYIYLLHPIFPVFIEFRNRFRIEFTEPPYRATLFFLPLFILSESLNPSSSLAFEVSSEKNRSLFPRCSKGTRIYPITFQIRYNFEERGGRGEEHKESNGSPKESSFQVYLPQTRTRRGEIRDASNEKPRLFSTGGGEEAG